MKEKRKKTQRNLKELGQGVPLSPSVVKMFDLIGLKLNPAKNESCALVHLISAERSSCCI